MLKLAAKLKLGYYLIDFPLSAPPPRGESRVESSRSFSNTNKPQGIAMMLEDEG